MHLSDLETLVSELKSRTSKIISTQMSSRFAFVDTPSVGTFTLDLDLLKLLP